MPYSGCVPAKVTVPSAGARTDVRGCALISMPPWNSVTRVHGERRLPNSELTEPRTGQRDGSAATALPARAIKRSRARRCSPCSVTLSARRSTSSFGESRSGSLVAPPPMPLSRAPGTSSGPNGSQMRAWSSRQPIISWRSSAARRLNESMVSRWSAICLAKVLASRVSSRSWVQSLASAPTTEMAKASPTKVPTATGRVKLNRTTLAPSPRTTSRLKWSRLLNRARARPGFGLEG